MTTSTTITPELLDQLLAKYEKPEDLTGEDGLFKQFKKALIERALGAELTEHLGYEKGDPVKSRPAPTPFRDPLKLGWSRLIHVVHRRAPRPAPRVSPSTCCSPSPSSSAR
jgi:hypothetical protein